MLWYEWTLSVIGGILVVVIVFILMIKIYVKLTTGKCKSKVRLGGKTTIVTGSNTGIGYETALDFAKRGAKVIVACRSQKTGTEAVNNIIRDSNNRNVFFKPLDLSSLKSVREFAEDINKSEQRLDILVHNAGAMDLPPNLTEDGLLLPMQTNYFGNFVLTKLLLDLMIKTPNSRIVNVASELAKYAGDFDVNKINSFPEGGNMKHTIMYSITKLCNILFTIELAERLKGTSVTTYSLHPGVVQTSIARNNKNLSMSIITSITRLFSKTPREGAQTQIYCSVAEGIENLSGQHFHDCHVVRRYKIARDPELPRKLWLKTEDLLNRA